MGWTSCELLETLVRNVHCRETTDVTRDTCCGTLVPVVERGGDGQKSVIPAGV